MMRKKITRTMFTSKINAYTLEIEDGQPKVRNLEPITVMGKATQKEALKALKDLYGKECSITIASIDVSEDVYEISVDDFLKYATKVGKDVPQSEEEDLEESENN